MKRIHNILLLSQSDQTGDSRATTGPKPSVTMRAQLANFLLLTKSSFIFITLNDLKNRYSHHVCCFTHKCQTCLWLQIQNVKCKFSKQVSSDTRRCRGKFNMQCYSAVTCACFSTVHISAHTTVISPFRKSIVRDNGNWLLLTRNNARRVPWPLSAMEKALLGPREEKIWTTL